MNDEIASFPVGGSSENDAPEALDVQLLLQPQTLLRVRTEPVISVQVTMRPIV